MLAPLPIRRARQAATALHDKLGLHDIHALDLDALALKLGVRIRRGGLRGASARLVAGPDFALVRLSSSIEHEGAQRFSFAHEVGHWHLQHRSDQLPCGQEHVGGVVDRGVEAEANAFAAELLMPARRMRSRCEVSPVSLGHARAIADEYRVSLVAAALRFVELTSERCAAVYSTKERVVWAARSETFTPFLDRRGRLSATTIAADWFRCGRTDEGPERVPADAWFEHDGDPDIDIWEDSTPILATASVLSLLWIPEKAARGLRVDRD